MEDISGSICKRKISTNNTRSRIDVALWHGLGMDGWISRQLRHRVVRYPNPLAIGSQLGNLTRYRESTVLIISDGKL